MTCGTCTHFWAGERKPHSRRAGHCLFPLPLPLLPAAYTRKPNGEARPQRELKAELVGPSSCEGCPTWESVEDLDLSLDLAACPSCTSLEAELLATNGAIAVRCTCCGLTSSWVLPESGLAQGEAMRQAARNWQALVSRLNPEASAKEDGA